MKKISYVLVHGFWLGGWAWSEVAPVLEAEGHSVEALTLPGLESMSADRSTIGLVDHIDHVTGVVHQMSGPVVLVGHSAGGAVIHGVVDRDPARIRAAVYVDTRPLPHGVALNPTLAGDSFEVPLRPWDDFAPGQLADLDESHLDHFAKYATTHPARAARDLQQLSDPRRFDVPVTIITTSSSEADMRALAASGDPLFSELPRLQRLCFIELPTGHYPMFSRPQQLAEAILAATAGD